MSLKSDNSDFGPWVPDCEPAEFVWLSCSRWWSGECVLSLSWQLKPCPMRSEAGPSSKSLRRLRRQIENAIPVYLTFLTLTYPSEWPSMALAKGDLRRFLERMRLAGYAESVIWVMEWQTRGAPHFHLVSTARFIDHKWVARSWWKASQRRSSLQSGSSISKILGNRGQVADYMSKIALEMSKKRQKESRGWTGRMWGVVGDRSVYPMEAVEACVPRVSAVLRLDELGGSYKRHFRFRTGLWIRRITDSDWEGLVSATSLGS